MVNRVQQLLSGNTRIGDVFRQVANTKARVFQTTSTVYNPLLPLGFNTGTISGSLDALKNEGLLQNRQMINGGFEWRLTSQAEKVLRQLGII